MPPRFLANLAETLGPPERDGDELRVCAMGLKNVELCQRVAHAADARSVRFVGPAMG